MASIILGEIASGVGGAMFGSVGQAVGLGVGSYLGREIDNALMNGKSIDTESARLSDIYIQTSTYGRTIPNIYGNARIAGNIIWSSNVNESSKTDHKDLDVFGINEHSHTSYNYHVSIAIALCEGPIDEITRIWANSKIVPLELLNYRFYKGCEDQLPDPLIEGLCGINRTPAFRGLAYIVIENLSLKDFGGRIPNFTFEVKRKLLMRSKDHIPLEDQIKSMVIIPGSGEFVYDTITQKKEKGKLIENQWISTTKLKRINENNNLGISDAVLSLNQLQNAVPNLKWAAPVIGWYANSMNLRECELKPAVEFVNGISTVPDMWHVNKFHRQNAYEISKDKFGNPNYGGTTSDNSLLRYLKELRARNLKIMLYPMFFMDVNRKPWRGRLTGDAKDVDHFFNKKYGYKNFILHYANLVKGKVNAFIIGSELVGLTKIKDNKNNFPAIDNLVEIAKQVKEILGPNVKVTYAADWSEYHHTEGGFYNLDKLWGCDAIDMVGIDAYFPLTNIKEDEYDPKAIKRGWESGEGYNYYLDDKKKRDLAPEYAWKNIKYWWENEHFNPDGTKTSWIPKSKKIWFTEIGFPSVDCAANQPNVFYDPKSSECGFPKNSSGSIDNLSQEIALSASLEYWHDSPMVEEKFIWCWDARPYPFWPDLDYVWSDGKSWSRGHWLNGKIGISTLGAIVLDICKKANLREDQIDVSELIDKVEGFVLTGEQSAKEVLEALQKTYFFDIVETDRKIKFIKRTKRLQQKVNRDDLITFKISKDVTKTLKLTRTKESDLPTNIKLNFLDKIRNYEFSMESAVTNHKDSNRTISISVPQILSKQKAKLIAKTILDNFWEARNFYQFTLPVKYINLEVGNLIDIDIENESTILRILNITFGNKRTIEIVAVSENKNIYKHQILKDDTSTPETSSSPGKTILHILDLPKLPFETNNNRRVLIAAEGEEKKWRGAKVITPTNDVFYLNNNITGKVLSSDNEELEIALTQGELKSVYQDNFKLQNIALIGDRVIRFENANMISEGVYNLSVLDKNYFNDKSMFKPGERFILLNNSLKIVEMPDAFLGKEIFFSAISMGDKIDNISLFSKILTKQTNIN